MERTQESPVSWSFLCHCHTRHSFDSLVDPTALVRHAARLGIDVLAVTDHDTWQGSVDARAAAEKEKLDLTVILASEVATEQGDVIGLFMTSDLVMKSAPAFCDAIHAMGGLTVLPHPYKWHKLDEPLLSRIDLIEVHNGRTSRGDNIRAAELAFQRGLPELAGPDAHRLGELELARVVFEGDRPRDEAALKEALLRAPRRLVTSGGSHWNEWYSQWVKLKRRPSLSRAFALARDGVRRLVKPRAYGPE
jgi:predicted metal-dependent phosphoesterase TrpH